jgi:hypothetical protein
MKRLVLILLPWLLAMAGTLTAREVQSHGLLFEKWVRDTFFDGYTPKGYTQRWDIPAEANTKHGGIPVNPKAIKYGTPVDLGDAIRQFEITERGESFMLIVGFWEQTTPKEKRWVQAQAVTVTPELWKKLWHPVTRADLEKLVAVIKDKSLSLEDTRAKAKEMKSVPPFTEAVIEVNPKIDSSQRRLQCSIGFKDFFKHLAPEANPEKQEQPTVFGIAVPVSFASAPRVISPDR